MMKKDDDGFDEHGRLFWKLTWYGFALLLEYKMLKRHIYQLLAKEHRPYTILSLTSFLSETRLILTCVRPFWVFQKPLAESRNTWSPT